MAEDELCEVKSVENSERWPYSKRKRGQSQVFWEGWPSDRVRLRIKLGRQQRAKMETLKRIRVDPATNVPEEEEVQQNTLDNEVEPPEY